MGTVVQSLGATRDVIVRISVRSPRLIGPSVLDGGASLLID